ncbi:MAG TPA: hypothetical protein P5307_24145, partial [Pirellulaceae bacterium]|nr:hypothetical protein [Pirellulaceae bacterium]
GKHILSLDFSTGESLYAIEPVDNETPERTFERRWTLNLLEIVQQRLCEEYTASGKQQTYDLLKPQLVSAGSTESYEQVAAQLGSSVGAVKTAVYRMRCRYRELLRTEIAETVADPAAIDDEIKQLFASLG